MKDFFPQEQVQPRRGQIFVTKPIKDLKFKGTFFFQDDTYFRDYYGRLMFGGGRHLDLKTETTNEIKTTPQIMDYLKRLCKEYVLTDTDFEIEHEWAGILGFQEEKNSYSPIIKQMDDSIFCAMSCSGMGVALTSNTGEHLAKMIYQDELQEVQLMPKF